MLFLVAVVVAVVAAVVLFLLVSIYGCLRVLVCSVIVEERRSVTRAAVSYTHLTLPTNREV